MGMLVMVRAPKQNGFFTMKAIEQISAEKSVIQI